MTASPPTVGRAPTSPAAAGGVAEAIRQALTPRLGLLSGHAAGPAAPVRAVARAVDPALAGAIARLALRDGPAPLIAACDALLDDGWSFERVCLDALTPGLRRLGAAYNDDSATFADVTLGSMRIAAALRALDRAAPRAAPIAGLGRAPVGVALIAPAPGEHHTIGAAMLAALFERAGWSVRGGAALDADALAAAVADEAVDVAAVSVSTRGRMESAARLVARLRRASRNRGLGVMIGGPALAERPELAARMGADATAADAPLALRQAAKILDLLAEPRRSGR